MAFSQHHPLFQIVTKRKFVRCCCAQGAPYFWFRNQISTVGHVYTYRFNIRNFRSPSGTLLISTISWFLLMSLDWMFWENWVKPFLLMPWLFVSSDPQQASYYCNKSVGWCKKGVTQLLMHWSYVFLALTHGNESKCKYNLKFAKNKFC